MPTTYEQAIASADSIEERIRQRAHELYLMRGNGHGSTELDDWLEAEREILAEDRQVLQE
jgi:hypothetical protein